MYARFRSTVLRLPDSRGKRDIFPFREPTTTRYSGFDKNNYKL